MEAYKQVQQLIEKKRKGFTDLKQIILTIRNQSLKLSDSVIEYGLQLVKGHKNKLGDEYFIILEEIFYAGLEVGTAQTLRLSQKCLLNIKSKFPESEKVERMEAMFYEANKDDGNSLDILNNKIQSNLLDTEAKKRKLSILRREGHNLEFIEGMNQYLYNNSSDGEAWMELGDIYLENLNYNKAVYCYEELLILFPKKFFYMMKIAEIYYTIGGKIQNYQNAKHYFSFVLSKDSKNHRAQWGLIQTCRKINQIKKDPKNTELLELCLESIKQQYKNKNAENLIEKINWSNYLK